MAQRMKDQRVAIGDKRRQNFESAFQSQKSHETLMKAQNRVVVDKSNENVEENHDDDPEIRFLFKSTDLLRTFKQDPVGLIPTVQNSVEQPVVVNQQESTTQR